MEFAVTKEVYTREAVLLCVQRFLGKFWVSIAATDRGWAVTMRPKTAGDELPSLEQFENALVEAAFLEQRSRETLPLRHALLSKALGAVRPSGAVSASAPGRES